jgi:hypothetical protein
LPPVRVHAHREYDGIEYGGLPTVVAGIAAVAYNDDVRSNPHPRHERLAIFRRLLSRPKPFGKTLPIDPRLVRSFHYVGLNCRAEH